MTTTGPNDPGTAADDSAVGSAAWASVGYILSGEGSEAYFASAGGTVTSHYAKATNFGFSLASDQVIDGILVEIRRRGSITGTYNVRDATVKLVIGGTVSGSNLADTGTDWPYPQTYASYGGASSLWGLTPTYADINGSTFGVVISAVGVSASKGVTYGYVDHIRITVYHHTGAAGFIFPRRQSVAVQRAAYW